MSDTPEDIDEETMKRKVNRSLMDEFSSAEFDKLSVDDQLKCVKLIQRVMYLETTKLDEPENFKHRGRPVGALNKRLLSGWEISEMPEQEQTPPKKLKSHKGKGTHSQTPGNKRPRLLINKRYHGLWPQCMGKWIQGWHKIIGDGNCGFRSIVVGLGRSE